MSTTLQDLVKQRADLDAQIAAAKAADFHTAGIKFALGRPPAARQGRAEVPPPHHGRDVDGPGQAAEVVCCGRAERN